MLKEKEILNNYLRKKGMKQSKRRLPVLKAFLDTERHVTADQLYDIVLKEDPSIGRVTIYRTIKILVDCGLAREIKDSAGVSIYEHSYRHSHHDHLYCNRCNTFFEVFDRRIEELQDSLARSRGFTPENHVMTIYGRCEKCVR